MCLQSYFLKEKGSILRSCNDRNKIPIVYQMISARNCHSILALNCCEKNITAIFVCDLRNRHTIQTEFWQNLKFKKLYTAFGKRINLDRSRKTQQSGNFLCSSQFRVHDHGKTESFFDKTDFLAVNRISYAGDCLAVPGFLCDKAAEKI